MIRVKKFQSPVFEENPVCKNEGKSIFIGFGFFICSSETPYQNFSMYGNFVELLAIGFHL